MTDCKIRRYETGFGGTHEHCPPKPFSFFRVKPTRFA
jgi:hypothetical protein